ncbi:MFS transporter [Pseudomonas sp. HR96]|uniref:MFS transporter n=1 Tax=Pseudomonas sp. HR96 TaxID=1027966 RepID=UPI002A761DE0|nr:MFS transporter [Pseudomonas sp. HR96]WPP02013.1 MFS transporter [Pseudomonas sp. HR96]
MAHSLNPRVYVLTFTAFVMLSSEFIVAGLLPQIATALQISIGDAGWLVTAFAVGMGVSAPVIAAFTHKVSLRHLLIAACVALVLGNTLCAVTRQFPLLLLGRALGGVGVAIFWTNAALTAAAISAPEVKTLAMSRVLIGVSIASVVGVPLGKAVSDLWGWSEALVLMAVLSVLALLMVMRWVQVPAGDPQQAHPSLAQRLKALGSREIALALLSYLLVFGGIMALFSYLATFLIRYSDLPAGYVTPLLALYGVADIVGNLLIAKRVPDPLDGLFKRLLVVLGLAMLALSLFGTRLWLLPLVIVVIGGCHAASGLLTGLDILRRAGANARLVGAFNVAAINVGIVLGALTGGLLIDHVGLQFIGCLGAAFIALALLTRACMPPARPAS